MKNLKEKKGISLIVLIITIIVMIILAAAIILSISNSGIMSKANKAKRDSDSANITEYVNVLEAEWELMDTEERQNSDYTSKEEYVNGKLEDKGYTQALLMEDGTLYTNLQANAKKALEAGIKIGNVVKYEVTSKTKMSYATENGASNQDISNKTDFVWRYIGVSDNGEIMIAPDVTADAPELTLYGATGYLKGPDELNRLCDVLYSTDKGTARSMTIEDVNKLLGYIGPKGGYISSLENWIDTDTPLTIQQIVSNKKEPALTYTTTPERGKAIGDYYSDYYSISKSSEDITNTGNVDYVFYGSGSTNYYYWLASQCVLADFQGDADFDVRCVGVSAVRGDSLFNSHIGDYDCSGALRPVVSLTSNIQKSTENGNTVWIFA